MPVEQASTHRGTSSSPSGSSPAGRIRSELASRIGAEKYETWFGHAELKIDGDRLEVTTGSQFIAQWIGNHYAGALRSVARDALGDAARIDVKFMPDSCGRRDPVGEPAEQSAPDRDGRRVARRHPRRTGQELRRLDEFIVGRSNQLAFSAAARFAEGSDARPMSPLFIHGECGLGKTHLLQGLCRRFTEMGGRGATMRYVTGEQFTNEFISAVRNGTLDEFRRRTRKLDLLAIDDVHFLSNKVRTQSEFLHTLDAIDLTGARVVLASDAHPRQIRCFSQALISRFLSGMVVRIDRPDRETRVTLTQRLATERGLELNDAALDMLVCRCVGSVRELQGAITKLTALRTLADGGCNGTVGVALTSQLFKDGLWQPSMPVRMGTIIDTVCQRLSVVRPELMGSGRHRRVVLARALIAYLGRELTTHSYPEIAASLGRSYHSTVHSAAQRIKTQIESGATVLLEGGGPPQPMQEIAEQLRHEVLRGSARETGS